MVSIETIFDVVRYGLVGLFVLLVIHLLGTVIVGGYMYPMMNTLAPNSTTGITTTTYLQINNNLWWSLKTALYIAIGTIFVFILFKLLYEKEPVSTNWGA